MLTVRYRDRRATFDPITLAFEADDGLARAHVRAETPAPRPADETPVAAPRRPVLERLVLNVANYCNLDCVYCYAGGGGYGRPPKRMSIETARHALLRVWDEHGQIPAIQFFGGEPLLNWRTIEGACRAAAHIADTRSSPLPAFLVVTNGTIMSDRVLGMLKTHRIQVTVSLDGPPEISDRLRPSRGGGGGGPSSLVERNVRMLHDLLGQPGQIEATYTRLHLESKCSVWDVVEYVWERFGVCSVHVPMNALPPEAGRSETQALHADHVQEVADYYSDAVARSIRAIATRPVGTFAALRSAVDILTELVFPRRLPPRYACPAGSGTLAVDVDGMIYPCFMFYGQSAYQIGNTRSANLLDEVARARLLERIELASDGVEQTSWASRFVSRCVGADFLRQGRDDEALPDDPVVTAMVSAAIVELAWLKRDDPERFYFLPNALSLYRRYLGVEP
jgi:uncharacterized protein